MKPSEQYNNNVTSLSEELIQLNKTKNKVAIYRLVVVIATAILADWAFYTIPLSGWIIILIGIALFLYLVSVHVNNKNIIQNKERLLKINQDELDYLQGRYHHQYAGEEFQPHEHVYANDMDIFGKASLPIHQPLHC